MADDNEDIAIVGIGCMFPGSKNADEFWRVLVNGENHVIDIPKERWNVDAFYSEDKDAPGKSYVKKAGLLQGHDEWDNHLYGISETEAAQIDPQQRYVLDCVHMALEDGGFTKAHLDGSNTGVYIGCMNHDYKGLFNRDLEDHISYTSTGMSSTLVSARVSYTYNFQGPCMTLDTACSSALVAVHLACQAIKSGDCDMAICGGVNSILSPDIFPSLCRARMMSAVGQCQTFCDTADGYTRGEGCGIIILKRYSQATKEFNKAWAVIKTGTNHDGNTVHPITAPSGKQQEKLLKRVYKRHHIDPATVQYIEAHGTGTPIGDPTETNSIGHFFHKYRKRRGICDPLLIGSVKSNIGHLESASGVASLIKVLLMMKHCKIVPSLHVKPDKSNVNKKLLLDEYNLDIAKIIHDWEQNANGQRVACINCMGFGGSNSHAIVIQKSVEDNPVLKDTANKLHTICISAMDRETLEKNINSFKTDIESPEFNLADVAYTSCLHRNHLLYRIGLIASSKEELRKQCELKLRNVHKMETLSTRNIVFIYCGVGTTWNGMCAEMMAQNRVFQEAVHSIDTYFEPLAGWSIGKRFQESSCFEDPFLNHFAIFAVQVALTEVWKTLGIQPNAIVGQSVGEVAAAYAAAILPLEEAVKVAYYRSLILSKTLGGSMMVVGNKAVSQTEALCRNFNDVSVGVYISPKACTLTGNDKELADIKADLEKESTEYLIRNLSVKCAYHSRQVDSCTREIIEKLGTLKFSEKANTRIISTVTGCLAQGDDFKTGTYWADNIRKPVQFLEAVQATADKKAYNIYVEIGPRPVLRAHLSNILTDVSAVAIPSMNVKKELTSLYSSSLTLFESGVDIRWTGVYKNTRVPSSLPRYHFNRTKKLFFGRKSRQYLSGIEENDGDSHMFIKHSSTLNAESFQVFIDEVSTPFVQDHTLSGKVLVPGATYVEVGLHIGMKLLQKPINELTVSLEFLNPITPAKGEKYVMNIKTNHVERNEFKLEGEHENRTIFRGKVSEKHFSERPILDMNLLLEECTSTRNQEESYACLEKLQFKYGPSLRLVQESYTSLDTCLSKLLVPDTICNETNVTHFHPAIIDGIFQTFGMFESSENVINNLLPRGIQDFVVYGPPQKDMFVYAKRTSSSDSEQHFNAMLISPTGHIIAEVHNFFGRTIKNAKSSSEYGYVAEWIEVDLKPFKVSKENRILFVRTEHQTFLAPKFGEIVTVNTVNADDPVPDLKHTNSIETVVFQVSSAKEASLGGTFIDESSFKYYQYLKALLLQTLNDKQQISLCVITELTQHGHTGKEKTINVIGAELWGMLRSVRDELIVDDIRLIDIDPRQVDIDLLATAIFSPHFKQSDLRMCGSKLFQAKLLPLTDTVTTTMDFSMDEQEEASLMSVNPVKVEGAFFYKQNNKVSNSEHHTNMVKVKPISFFEHSNSVYITTSEPFFSSETFWPELHDNFGYQVIALEGSGTVMGTGEACRENVHYFCYPVAVGTFVSIPSECLIPKISCKYYAPGLLTACCIIYSKCLQVPNNQTVVVVSKSQNDADYDLIQALLSQKGCSVERYLLTKPTRVEHRDEVILIITHAIGTAQLKIVMHRYPNTKQIVASSHVFPHELVTWMYHMFPSVQTCISNASEIFFQKNIRSLFPKVKEWLGSIDFKTRKSSTFQLTGFSIPGRNVNLDNLGSIDKLPLRVDKFTLFRTNCCYIVVGGLSGLGWQLVNWMSEMGAGYIAIFSRRNPSETHIHDIKTLETERNVHVISLQADITNINSLNDALAQLKLILKGAPVKGIFHGGGVLADSLLINQTDDQIKTAMRPKIIGAWNLHMISLEMKLDFFVLHSSIVSVIGNAGQCNYAAGNSFLDTLAAYRRAKGLCAQSINWGPLAVGMAANNIKLLDHLQAQGFKSLTKDEIKECLIQALIRNDTQVIFVNADWDIIANKSSFASQWQKFDGIIKNIGLRQQTTCLKASLPRSHYIAGLKDLDYERKKEEVKKLVVSICCDVFVVKDDSLTDATKLADIGLDSMSAMNFVNTLYKLLNIRIPVVTLLSEQATLNAVIEYFCAHMDDSEHQFSNDVSQFGCYFESEITFNKEYFLKNHFRLQSEGSMLNLIDVEIMDHDITDEDWTTAFEYVLRKNSELRVKYQQQANGSIIALMSSPEHTPVPLEHVPYSDIASTMYTPEGVDPRIHIYFNIETDIPIKFQLAHHGSSTLLRLILHKVVGDVVSIFTIFEDIEFALQETKAGRKLKMEWPTLDIQSYFKKTFLPKMHNMYSYWKTKLRLKTKPVTLAYSLQPIDPKFYTDYKLEVPGDTVAAIETYIQTMGITLFHFMASVYQLLLYFETRQDILTIITPIDLRLYIPELTGTVSRFSQYIPVLVKIIQSLSVREFLMHNSKDLAASLENGCFPPQLIMDLFDHDMKLFVDRHLLVVNYMKHLKDITGDRGSYFVNLKQVLHMPVNCETAFWIAYDKSTSKMSFEFSFNVQCCGLERGQGIPNKILAIITECITNDSRSIASLMEAVTSAFLSCDTIEIQQPKLESINKVFFV